jgi:hypothetical protein
MVAIPPWLRMNSDVEQPLTRHQESISHEGSGGQRCGANDDCETEIPIFCAGGCGEVVGYLPKGQEVADSKAGNFQRWCPTCKAANDSNKGADKAAFTGGDELAGLRKPARGVAWLGLLQVAIVAIIIAGSVCIAMGRAIGIYLAAFGTLAWFVISFVLRKLGG